MCLGSCYGASTMMVFAASFMMLATGNMQRASALELINNQYIGMLKRLISI